MNPSVLEAITRYPQPRLPLLRSLLFIGFRFGENVCCFQTREGRFDVLGCSRSSMEALSTDTAGDDISSIHAIFHLL